MADGTFSNIQFMIKTTFGMELITTMSDWEESLNHENLAQVIWIEKINQECRGKTLRCKW